jgi:hypothetical protein
MWQDEQVKYNALYIGPSASLSLGRMTCETPPRALESAKLRRHLIIPDDYHPMAVA